MKITSFMNLIIQFYLMMM